MKLQEIADKIKDHLKRFESDKTINAAKDGRSISPYYNAWATRSGRYVRVTYVSFQGSSSLSKAEAEAYLEWLNAGNIGKHYKALSFNERIKSTQHSQPAGEKGNR
jgi:hypothetical protein